MYYLIAYLVVAVFAAAIEGQNTQSPFFAGLAGLFWPIMLLGFVLLLFAGR